MSAPSLFCFGLGYTARHLARRLRPEGWIVAGTARQPPVAAGEFPLHRFAPDHKLVDAARILAGVTHVLVSVPPDRDGCPVFAAASADLAAQASLEWLGYLSTTSVYGDRGGAWVDEESALAPTGDRGAGRVKAEARWLDWGVARRVPVNVFRRAVPARNTLDALGAGTARRIVKPGQVFSRIHVDDLAETLARAMTRRDPERIYNVCDDEAAAQDEVVAFAASLLGVNPPPLETFDGASLSPLARSFYDDNKRVANRRIKDELGVVLRYPSYRDGLTALNRAAASAS